jgi:hypothetical protein
MTPDGNASVPSWVMVEGQSYRVAIARYLMVPEKDLVPHGQATDDTVTQLLVDGTTFRLPGIAPTVALVARPRPGLADDSGSVGDFILLCPPVAILAQQPTNEVVHRCAS